MMFLWQFGGPWTAAAFAIWLSCFLGLHRTPLDRVSRMAHLWARIAFGWVVFLVLLAMVR